jgi:hypothetical protein
MLQTFTPTPAIGMLQNPAAAGATPKVTEPSQSKSSSMQPAGVKRAGLGTPAGVEGAMEQQQPPRHCYQLRIAKCMATHQQALPQQRAAEGKGVTPML